jgi:hypothetical protein
MIKLYISEYAKAKNTMEQELQAKVDVILEHLIKLILMPDNETYKHWQGEIAGQLHTVHKLKGKNKYPTYKQLYDWTYIYALDEITDIMRLKMQIKNLEMDYNFNPTMNATQLSNKLNDVCICYFDWLCHELSEKGFVSNTQIYRKLDMLIQ